MIKPPRWRPEELGTKATTGGYFMQLGTDPTKDKVRDRLERGEPALITVHVLWLALHMSHRRPGGRSLI